MKSKLERIEKNEVALEIEVPEEKVAEALDKAFKKVAQRVTVPGFRKGRVPRPVLEAYYGKEILYEDALEQVIPAAYEQAVEENDIEPVSQPAIDVVQMEEGKPLIFTARVVVKPEVILGQVEGIEVSRPPIEVKEEDVERRLQVMRDRYAKLVEIGDDTPTKEGDVLTIDFAGYIDGEPFPGGKGEDYSLELGSKTFIPGFEEQLVGARVGEEREITVRFPDDYHAKDLAGKEALFKVKIKEAKRRELSPLNDEFAQEVSEFETLEELREDIRKNLVEMAEQRARQMMKDELIAKAADSAEVDIPRDMIENQVDVMLEQFQERLLYQGISLEQYLEMTGATVEDLKEEYRPQAERIVRNNLVLEKVAEQYNIKVTDEDFEQQMNKVAGDFGMNVDEVKKRVAGSRARIERGILLDKAVEYLVEKAVVLDKPVEKPELAVEE
ncbi:MAG: trigger factor [Syntrophomonadaceae bacterium]|nr:trigger factor [Syntrophomonadaceae bacterium]